jgi:hypothetical protein
LRNTGNSINTPQNNPKEAENYPRAEHSKLLPDCREHKVSGLNRDECAVREWAI